MINLISRAFAKSRLFRLFSDIRQILVAQCFNFKSVETTNVTIELMYSKIVICVRLEKIDHQCLIRKN